MEQEKVNLHLEFGKSSFSKDNDISCREDYAHIGSGDLQSTEDVTPIMTMWAARTVQVDEDERVQGLFDCRLCLNNTVEARCDVVLPRFLRCSGQWLDCP